MDTLSRDFLFCFGVFFTLFAFFDLLSTTIPPSSCHPPDRHSWIPKHRLWQRSSLDSPGRRVSRQTSHTNTSIRNTKKKEQKEEVKHRRPPFHQHHLQKKQKTCPPTHLPLSFVSKDQIKGPKTSEEEQRSRRGGAGRRRGAGGSTLEAVDQKKKTFPKPKPTSSSSASRSV